MQKLYSLCSLLLISLLTFAADAFTITFNVDNPDNVSIEAAYTEVPLVAGDNPIEFSSSWSSVYIKGKNGCKVTVKGPDGNNIDMPYGYMYSDETKYGGKTIYITSQKPEEYRTASVKVTIDKASAVKIGVHKTDSELSYYPDLTDGENTIYYEPEVDKMLKIYSSVSAQVPLYSVNVVNGTTEPVQTNFVYKIALPCDGDIEVKGVFPDKACTVTINEAKAVEGFVTKITKDNAKGEEVDFSAGSFEVNAGTVLYIHGNTDKYLLTSYNVDGTQQEFTTPQRLVVIDKDINVSFDGRPYEIFNISVNTDNPAAIIARYGSKMEPGDIIDLKAGNNTVVISENNTKVFFAVANAHDYKFATVNYNGAAVKPDYTGIIQLADLRADDKIEVTTTAIIRDQKAVIYIDDANGDFNLTDAFGGEVALSTGYNHIEFCAEDVPFKLKPTSFYNTSAFVYSNDEEVSSTGFGNSRTWNINIANGSVVKIFAVATDEPEWYTLNFEENGFDAVDVLADEMRPITDRVGFETLAATKIEIMPKADKDVKAVTVDGEPLTANAKGNYEFAVSGHHNIAVTSATGIDKIESTEATGSEIYNLQGIRVSGEASQLPEGIYIINGKKVLVK